MHRRSVQSKTTRVSSENKQASTVSPALQDDSEATGENRAGETSPSAVYLRSTPTLLECDGPGGEHRSRSEKLLFHHDAGKQSRTSGCFPHPSITCFIQKWKILNAW